MEDIKMEVAGFDRLKSAATATVQSDLNQAQSAQKEQERAVQQQLEVVSDSRADSKLEAQNALQSEAARDALSQEQAASGTAGLQQAGQAEASLQAKQQKEDEKSALAAAREQAREYIGSIDFKDYGLSFSVEQDLDKTLISVTDRANDKVIRQIPSEEFVQMARNIQKFTAADEAGTTDARGERVKKDEPKGVILDHLV